MKEVEFQLPRQYDPAGIEELIEQVCREQGLCSALKGTLAKYPGSVHWHYKKGKQSGTLELTFDRLRGRLWAAVQAGRQAQWIDSELSVVRRRVERGLRAIDNRGQDDDTARD
jgi:hypothetical protein